MRELGYALRAALLRAADPAKAPHMQAYMKSAMPFCGVQKERMREICRRIFPIHPPAHLMDTPVK